MASMEQPQPGVNGRIMPVTRHGRRGYVFRAADGSEGPFRPMTSPRDARAFSLAQSDWRGALAKR